MSSQFLILPMQPTPNGRLHIGHAAGPYLRADALARALLRRGEKVAVVCGTDVYENWVVLEARRLGVTPYEVCFRNHEGIFQDLRHIHVNLDIWINPLAPEHEAAYARLHEFLVSELLEAGTAFPLEESVPVSDVSGEVVMGAWIMGDCPVCGESVAGNSCVKCGAGFQPHEVVNPRSRLDHGSLSWQPRTSFFVEPEHGGEILRHLRAAGVPEDIVEIAETHIRRSGTRVRVSHPGAWGVKSALVDRDSVLTNTFYAYCLYCAERGFERMEGRAGNLLAKTSSATVVALFGKDNAGIGLVAPLAISLGSPTYRGFDKILVNHMLHFQGKKCSTSQRHGIWVSELIENSSVTGDELRYYLAGANLEAQTCSLSLEELISRINRLRSWKEEMLFPAIHGVSAESDLQLLTAALAEVRRQDEMLDPANFSMPAGLQILEDWMDRPTDDHDGGKKRSWLVGVSLLAEPFLPQLAREIWFALGFEGGPRTTETTWDHPPRNSAPSGRLERLAVGDIASLAHFASAH